VIKKPDPKVLEEMWVSRILPEPPFWKLPQPSTTDSCNKTPQHDEYMG